MYRGTIEPSTSVIFKQPSKDWPNFIPECRLVRRYDVCADAATGHVNYLKRMTKEDQLFIPSDFFTTFQRQYASCQNTAKFAFDPIS